jgi:maltokinase
MTRPPDAQVADQVLKYLTGARWFAGKGRQVELVSLTPLPWLTEVSEFFGAPGAPAVRFEIAEVRYPPDEDPDDDTAEIDHEFYQLAAAYRKAPQSDLHHAEIGRFTDADLGPAVAFDAAQDPQACRVILGALLASRMLRGPEETVGFHLADAKGLSVDLEPRVFTGQQSNTSVMLGEVAMIKLFRRLELGRNLDIEVHAALNAAGVEDVAGLFGWVEGTWVSGGSVLAADLAMVVEKLTDATDGWGLALDRLKINSGFADEAEALGGALADTHRAMREAFPTTRIIGASVAATMEDRLKRAAETAPALEPYVAGLRRCFDDLAVTTLDTQRVHGDFHLGQTLHTPKGWKIIDFEGEPAKTMAERLAPDSIWRDIAGMLRSFDYAAASVPGPNSGAWAAEARAAFLRGYAGGELSGDESQLLRAYEADKAIYEVVYETRNRPDWVGIPLGAVATLAGAPPPTPDDRRHPTEQNNA